MFRKITSQIEIYPDYTPTLSRSDFDKNESKIDLEIKNIEKKYPLNQQIAVNVNFNNKEQTLEDYLKLFDIDEYDIPFAESVYSYYDGANFIDYDHGYNEWNEGYLLYQFSDENITKLKQILPFAFCHRYTKEHLIFCDKRVCCFLFVTKSVAFLILKSILPQNCDNLFLRIKKITSAIL